MWVPAQDFVAMEKGKCYMKTISREYLLLFNALTDTEETLRQLREKLMDIQRKAEELFLEETDPVECKEAE